MRIPGAEGICLAIRPALKDDLYMAAMNYTTQKFSSLVVLMTLLFGIIFSIPIIWILSMIQVPLWMYFIVVWFIIVGIFLLLLHVPILNIQTNTKQIDKQVAILGRRLLIQIESGKSLVNALIDIGSKDPSPKNPLARIAYELEMGRSLEDTFENAIHYTKSHNMRKIFIQIRNSLRTGTNLQKTLHATLTEITREKIVEFEKFGKKLNSIGLFYMIFGTIFPSLGIIIFALGLTALSIPINLSSLSIFFVILIPIQVLFIMMFSKMRPELDI